MAKEFSTLEHSKRSGDRSGDRSGKRSGKRSIHEASEAMCHTWLRVCGGLIGA